jgi:2,4-dienoyl-CoA reductase-like NADH-dependent reductase (Old Yellow Enzyme family)
VIFDELRLAHLTMRNRVVRSATYEGYGDAQGLPRPELGQLYRTLAENQVGTIITGFAYVSDRGRAMHPAQTSIASDLTVSAWRRVLEPVRALPEPTVMLLQIAHAGLQTLVEATGTRPLAPSARRSPYFGVRAKAMSEREIQETIDEFAHAALRGKIAGFDGVQIHAAHGYLVHQFLSPYQNRRRDKWGSDRFAFFAEVVARIRASCGSSYPIFVKLSAPDGQRGGIDIPLACQYAARMESLGIEAVEVSYGTMDRALDIFRGDLPVERVFRYNPFYRTRPRWALSLAKRFVIPRVRRQLLPFSEDYNLPAAAAIKAATTVPVIVVGGLRRLDTMNAILAGGQADAVALCRPLICEPDLITRFRSHQAQASRCSQCNCCAIMCDHTTRLRCYQSKKDAALS